MKKVLLIIVVLGACFSSFNFPREIARVNRECGLFVYIESKPFNNYVILGTIKDTGIYCNRDLIITHALRLYPDAEGIIFDNVNLIDATIIKFKP